MSSTYICTPSTSTVGQWKIILHVFQHHQLVHLCLYCSTRVSTNPRSLIYQEKHFTCTLGNWIILIIDRRGRMRCRRSSHKLNLKCHQTAGGGQRTPLTALTRTFQVWKISDPGIFQRNLPRCVILWGCGT